MRGVRPTKRLLEGTLVSVVLGTLGCASALKVPQLIANETAGSISNITHAPRAEAALAEPVVAKPASTSSENWIKKK